ncbi:cytosol aminopeptidase-like [Adelges cooleyi]|uniref:cytosol aminopeptidase-like n=1 Tax=Adelges cooleyi TaxID=133065 RepID=UPI0021802F13|nr:cytosol aminopeptidase-like [Adelges cooleyi]
MQALNACPEESKISEKGIILLDSCEGKLALTPLKSSLPIADDEHKGYNTYFNRERIRESVAEGIKALIGSYEDDRTAAEAAYLTAWQGPKCDECWEGLCVRNHSATACQTEWNRGKVAAEAQNLARWVGDMQMDFMKPVHFAQLAMDRLCCCDVKVSVRDERWMESKKMTGILEAASTTCVPPLLVELTYYGKGNQGERPIVMVGRGSCLEECCRRGEPPKILCNDMGSAAAILGTFRGVAQMHLPVDLVAYIVLYGYNPRAAKQDAVVRNANSKYTMFATTRNEGSMVMSDAVYYSRKDTPGRLLTIDTQPTDKRDSFNKVFNTFVTHHPDFWREIRVAGLMTGDRLWQLMTHDSFLEELSMLNQIDLTNRSELHKYQGSGYNHAYLTQFVPCCDTIVGHLQINDRTKNTSDGLILPYLREELKTGRPTRTIIQLLYQLACPHEEIAPIPCCDQK